MSTSDNPLTIVLASDGSSTAAAAVQFVASFPFPVGTRVILLAVAEDDVSLQDMNDMSGDKVRALQGVSDAMVTRLREHLSHDAKVLQAAGLAATVEVRAGRPAAEIVAGADSHDADMIVVGSHGLTGVSRFLLGSVSSQVFHFAGRSVLIVRSSPMTSEEGRVEARDLVAAPRRILIAFDGSPEADRAIDLCAMLGLGEQASVQVLSILPMVRIFRQDIAQELDWVWLERKRDAELALARASDRLRAGRASVSTVIKEAGDVSEAILVAADDFDADIIMLGHKGAGGVERFLMGSATRRVAHHAKCSVVAVR